MAHDEPRDPVALWPRASGVLLHVTSLPMGDLGPDAYRFIEFLQAAGQTWWQIMPVGPPGAGSSPYAARSAFAGDRRLISVERLANDGLLEHGQLPGRRATPDEQEHLLRAAFERLCGSRDVDQFDAFVADNAWAGTYCRYAARRRYWGRPWWEWLEDSDSGVLAEEERFQVFCLWAFERQWADLRHYAHAHGVRLFGDLPIFVDLDSADVWAEPELFKLDSERRPRVVAGVPPDVFSTTGQRWGNPLYDWEAQQGTGFAWWVSRMARTFELVDAVRLDHFRGFLAAWEIPVEAEHAIDGEWVTGPGLELLGAIERELGVRPIAVEDLGIITPDVHAARMTLGYPGMAVLQFGFGDNERTFANPHLPHNHKQNSVVYTGTHDNDTTAGWWDSIDDNVKGRARRYVGVELANPVRTFIRLAQASVAHTVIVPFQDWLGLGCEARMNTPGVAEGNWGWYFDWRQVAEGLALEMREIAHVFGRDPASS